MDSSDDYYKILGLTKDATEPDISTAYRELVKKWHSQEDLSNQETAENDLKLITEAYEVLSDPVKRETYDQHGKKGLVTQAEAAAATVRPAGMSESGSDGEVDEDDIWNYDDVRDDVDDLNDMLERFSYGSNYDEDIDDFLNNDSNYDEAYGGEGDNNSVKDDGDHQADGDNGCNGLSVTEGW